jgi:hypothetical protein
MTSTNGHHALAPSGPIVREVLLDSGVVVRITPLSPHAYAKVQQRAVELHPGPDEENFRKPVPNAAIDGDTFIDKQDPLYLEQVAEANKAQTAFVSKVLQETSLEFPDGKDALIERFADKIATLRKFIDAPEDEWEATFLYGVIGSVADHETIVWAAQNALPLTGEEIVEGLRIFRYHVSGKRPGRVAAGRKVLAQSFRKREENKSPE